LELQVKNTKSKKGVLKAFSAFKAPFTSNL
jgi:hypothetical protein